MNIKAKITHRTYQVFGKILTAIGLEVHYKHPGYSWTYMPAPKAMMDLYVKYDVKNKSLVDISRLHSLYQFLSYAVRLPGDVAQLGVYKGGSVAVLASLVEDTGKKYYAFDTYEGLPPGKSQDNIHGYVDPEKPELADTSLESVKEYLKEYKNISYQKGLFPASIPQNLKQPGQAFCFVYLDGDLYQSTKDGLDFFFPRLSYGGVVVVDDYGSRRWAGVETAVSEFLAKEKNASLIQFAGSQAVILKLPRN